MTDLLRVAAINPDTEWRQSRLVECLHGAVPEPWVVVDDDPDVSTGRWMLVFNTPRYDTLRLDVARSLGVRHVSDVLTAEHLAALREGRAVLVIDTSTEGPPLCDIGAEELRESLDRWGVSPDRVIIASANARMADDLAPLGMGAADYDYHSIELAHRMLANPLAEQIAGLGRRVAERTGHEPLLCLNATPRGSRVALMACLLADGLADSLVTTWGGFDQRKSRPLRDYARWEAEQLLVGECADALAFLDAAMDLPERQFEQIEEWDDHLAFTLPTSLYAQTSGSLVTETLVRSDSWRLTEKTVKAFAAGHTTMVWGSAHSQPLVERYGFVPVGPAWVWAHDEVDDPTERLAALRATVRRVAADGLPMDDDVVRACRSNSEFALAGLWEHLVATMARPLFDRAAELTGG